MEPLISIIIPVYNVERYLDRCLESVVNQSYTNLEIILVDDGSPDRCPQMCDVWAKRDSRVKVIHKPNGGPSSARNEALDIASGEYFYFVDSDDYIEEELCEKIINLFEKYNADIVTFDCYLVDENGRKMGLTENVQEGILTPRTALLEMTKGNINNYAWNKVYKRQVFDNIRFPEGRLWEDMAIAYKLMLNASRIYCLSDKLYYYVQRKNSIVHTIGEKALQDIFLARYESYIDLKEEYPEVGDAVFSLVALSARRLYDRSLWAVVDSEVLEKAKAFLSENRDKVLGSIGDIYYKTYYMFPKLYTFIRVGRHIVGSIIRRIRR